MSIGKNIKKLREENHLTQREFANIAGVTDKAVSMWEQEKRDPRMGAMQKIADYFSLRMSELMGETELSLKPEQKDTAAVPVVEKIPTNGKDISDAEIKGYEVVKASFLETGETYIFYKISADNMEPVLKQGDLALIHLKNYVKSGTYCAISIDGCEPVMKKLIFSGDTVQLVDKNGGSAAECFEGEELRRLTVLGEVKRLIRNF